MTKQAEKELNSENNVTASEEEAVQAYDPEKEREERDKYFAEFTKKESPDADLEPEEPSEQDSEPEPEQEVAEIEETPDEPVDSDEEKAAKALEQAEQTKKGNKNYIDKDLINSIEDKELRQKVWNLANTAQSHYHRVFAKEQEVNQLRNKLAQLEAEREIAKRDATTAVQEKQVDKAVNDKIARLKRDYPDLAESIEALFQTELEGKTKELRELIDKNLAPIQQKVKEETRQSEISVLESAAKDIFQTEITGVTYKEVVASDDFKTWLESQDESIKKLAQSDRAAEVVTLLKTFEYDYSREYQKAYGKTWVQALTEQDNKAATNAPSLDPELAKKADALKQQRETKKKAAVTGIAPSRQSTSSDAQLDRDSLFNHFAKQSRYARGR